MRTLYTNFTDALAHEPRQMLVENGRILEYAPPVPSPDIPTIDLGGRYILPSFIDAHCHILPTGLDLLNLHLGTTRSHEEVLDLVRHRHEEQPDGWLFAVHYDQNRYGGVHLARHDLDRISSTRPIILRHVNGHASVANSAALTAAGVTDSTPDPAGGSFRRDADGRPDGVLFEDAHDLVSNAAPMPTLEEMVHAIMRAGEAMRSLGIMCATDMMTGRFDLLMELEAYRLAAERGCPIHTRLYLQWKPVFGPRAVERAQLDDAIARLDQTSAGKMTSRVSGIKIFADGAIASATAAIYGRYTGQTSTGPLISRNAKAAEHPDREVSGQLIYSPDRLHQMVLTAHEAGYSVATHSIGDYSTDLVMDAYEATGEPQRHRIEHAMLLSDAQIDRLVRLGCSVAFQPEFIMALGHAYLAQLGPERAAKIKRSRSVIDAGIPLSFNSDRPVVAGDPWDGILTASKRPEPFDPSENCTREEAILAYTVEGARVNGDFGTMGELKAGQLADFQLYEEDPLTASRPKPSGTGDVSLTS
jgi:hypothetical protein